MKAKWDDKPEETRKGVCYVNQDGIMTGEERPEVACCQRRGKPRYF